MDTQLVSICLEGMLKLTIYVNPVTVIISLFIELFL
jgi:hypothetical protein